MQRYVIMGVAGSGKTSIGEAIAAQTGWHYIDGDALHPQSNIDKMARGEPLNDDDRRPWLIEVGTVLGRAEHITMIGCSALKRIYRDTIRTAAKGDVVFIFLAGSRELIGKRMADRTGHFMPLSLLDSQFATLEPPSDDESFLEIDIDQEIDGIVAQTLNKLRRESTDG